MGRIAVSISHESEFAVAVAFGVRTAGGKYVFPLDIDARLDDRDYAVAYELGATLEAAGSAAALSMGGRMNCATTSPETMTMSTQRKIFFMFFPSEWRTTRPRPRPVVR